MNKSYLYTDKNADIYIFYFILVPLSYPWVTSEIKAHQDEDKLLAICPFNRIIHNFEQRSFQGSEVKQSYKFFKRASH